MIKALFIVGPTAVGKTKLAVEIHKKVPSILISADSIQVYRGADIISGKDHPEDIKIELVDVFPPTEPFSVKDFVDLARVAARKAEKENKLPIIVGGTGLYTRALYKNIETVNIPQNKKLRNKLSKLDVQELRKKLSELNEERYQEMNNSDKNNPRRLIRAIEIAEARQENSNSEPIFKEEDVLMIGLTIPEEDLKNNIHDRVLKRVENDGMIEARQLYKQYSKLAPQIKSAIGYSQFFDFLQDKITIDELAQEFMKADFNYSKRQMTWFKKDKNIVWFDTTKRGFQEQILSLITHKLDL